MNEVDLFVLQTYRVEYTHAAFKLLFQRLFKNHILPFTFVFCKHQSISGISLASVGHILFGSEKKRLMVKSGLQPTYFCNQHIFATIIFLQPNYFRIQNIFAAKLFLQPKYFCRQNIFATNFFAAKIFLQTAKKKGWHQKRRKTGTRKEEK